MANTMQFLGSGSAFSYENGQNNVLLSLGDGSWPQESILIDAGTQWHDMVKKVHDKTVAEFLATMNVTKLFITHLHADHIGGIEELGFLTRFIPGLKKMEIIAPAQILEELWLKSLRGGMESLDFGQLTKEEEGHPIGLDSYFIPSYLGDNMSTRLAGGVEIEHFSTAHVSNRMGTKPSCGYYITSDTKTTLYTSDTQYCPSSLVSMYKKVDQIFHDCETMAFPSNVHAHYGDLIHLPEDVKAKIWLTHYNDGEKPDCVADGFAGWVQQGDSFDI